MHKDVSWENLKEIDQLKTVCVGRKYTGPVWHRCTEHGSFKSVA
jgi:hypothetical protein